MIWIIGLLVLFLITVMSVLPIWGVQWKPNDNKEWVTISSYQMFWLARHTLSGYHNCGNSHRMWICLWK